MLFDRDVVSFCFSYEDEGSKKLELLNAFTLLLKTSVRMHIYGTHTSREGEEKINLLEKLICQRS